MQEFLKTKKDMEYYGKCWKTNHLKRCVENELEIIIYGLKEDKELFIEKGTFPTQEFQSTTPDTIKITMGNWVVSAKTYGGALAKLISLMMDGITT